MDRTYLRGDLYFADLSDGIGSEQKGNRPVVIIQNDVGNRNSPTVIVAAVSSKVDAKAKLPTHYYLGAENGLERPSVILLEQLRTIDKRRLGRYIGRLSKKHIDGVDQALAISLDLVYNVYNISDALIMRLCSSCADSFRDTDEYSSLPIVPNQTNLDTCTCCSQRLEHNYVVAPLKR